MNGFERTPRQLPALLVSGGILALLTTAACYSTGWFGTSPGGSTFLPTMPATNFAGRISDGFVGLAQIKVNEQKASEIAPEAPMTIPAQADGTLRPGDRSAADTVFIVKFADKTVETEVARIFRKDPDGARARFATWTKANGWTGFELVGASYSGEVMLRLADDAPDELSRRFRTTSARDMADQMAARDGVVYCDPDYTAGPGEKTP